METNKVLIVLGMHRSGTSLTAQWLHACGLHMGDVMHGPDIGNPDGHFEDVDFLEVHEKILQGYDIPSGGFIDKPLPAPGEFETSAIKKILRKKQASCRQWGWKEPRTCLFLDVYRELLPGARYLVVYRDYHEVVGSLISRYFKVWQSVHFHTFPRNIPIAGTVYKHLWMKYKYAKNEAAFFRQYSEYYLRVWNLYNTHLLRHIQALSPGQYLLVNAGQLGEAAGDVFDVLTGSWGFELEQAEFSSVYKAGMYNAYPDVSAYVGNTAVLEQARQIMDTLARESNTGKAYRQALQG